MERPIWPITLVVCIVAGGLTAPGIIRAVKEPAVIVQPDDKPVVNTFADEIAAAWKANGGTSEDACQLVDAYSAIANVVNVDSTAKKIADTEKLAEITKLGSLIAMGSKSPFGDKYKFLNGLMQGELRKRGIYVDEDKDGNPDVVAVDHAAWMAFYSDVIKGLSQ